MPVLHSGDVYWWKYPQITARGEPPVEDFRPVIVLRARGTDLILGMLTTRDYQERGAVQIAPDDYAHGGTDEISYFRPERLWTDHQDWQEGYIGRVTEDKLRRCREAVAAYLNE